jgi:hypothetical protein
MYTIGDKVIVNDRMQKSYEYLISEQAGRNYDPEFDPHLNPKEMLEMGVFEGKYCNDCQQELPPDWFYNAKISKYPNPSLNYFSVKSRQSLMVWKLKGWIVEPDPRGWFQWYCRYYLGRRLPDIDQHQIKRWKAFKRHESQVRNNCEPGDCSCRPRQRQALLQWAYNPTL